MNELIELNTIKDYIFIIRGKKVMIDKDLAQLYGVPTYRLNEAVKRNIKRFPDDFMFKLNDNELKELIANCDRLKTLKHSSNPPYVFTEHGVAMLSSVLSSDKAIEINIQIMRAFIALRQFALECNNLQEQIIELKKFFIQYAQDNDEEIAKINTAINLLMDRTKPNKIGFNANNESE